MINRVYKGSGIKGALQYVLHDKNEQTNERATVLGSNLDGENVNDFSKQFADLWKIRQSQGKKEVKDNDTVRHFVLSLPAGEKLTDAQWNQAGEKFLQKMGFIDKDGNAKTHYMMVRHDDTNKDHIHIVASRLTFDGNLVAKANEQHKALKATRDIAAEFSLKPLERQAPTSNHFKINLEEPADGFPEALERMTSNKQYALRKLSSVLGTDLSKNKWIKDNLVFCSNANGKTTAKFKDNVSLTLTAPQNTVLSNSANLDFLNTSIRGNQNNQATVQALKQNLAQVVAIEAVAIKQTQPQLGAFGSNNNSQAKGLPLSPAHYFQPYKTGGGSNGQKPNPEKAMQKLLDGLEKKQKAPAAPKAAHHQAAAPAPTQGLVSAPPVSNAASHGEIDSSIIALMSAIAEVQGQFKEASVMNYPHNARVAAMLANLKAQLAGMEQQKASLDAIQPRGQADSVHAQQNHQQNNEPDKENDKLTDDEKEALALINEIKTLENQIKREKDPEKQQLYFSLIQSKTARLRTLAMKMEMDKKLKSQSSNSKKKGPAAPKPTWIK